MITIKLPIQINEETKERILKYQKQYSNLLHVYFNRYKEGLSQKECKHLELNNVELLDSWFRQSCIYEAMSLVKLNKDRKVIFGGKFLFKLRSHKSISKEEFELKRLNPIYSIGEGTNSSVKCNRKFFIESTSKIIFKPSRTEKIELNIKVSGKYKRYLELLIQHHELKDLSITYKLNSEHIWISFDESILKDEFKQFKPIQNRIISIDMNPNYIRLVNN